MNRRWFPGGEQVQREQDTDVESGIPAARLAGVGQGRGRDSKSFGLQLLLSRPAVKAGLRLGTGSTTVKKGHAQRFRLANSPWMLEILGMIELFQFPFSPFCIPSRRILEFAGVKFKVTDIPPQDRSLVWKVTKHRYYGVPVIRDGRNVVFDDTDDQQIVAKYLDQKLKLGLFPAMQEGVQSLLWRNIESEIEGATFRLNDIYYQENVAAAGQLQYLRFKERKFGRGCIDQWRTQQKDWLAKLESGLVPFEQMLEYSACLLSARPLFVDFDLFGMLENFLYSGHYQLPKSQPRLRDWHRRMKTIRL